MAGDALKKYADYASAEAVVCITAPYSIETSTMKNIKKVVLVFLFACSHAQAASFDCAKARSTQEKQICSNKELSELDAQLGEAYSKVQKVSSANEAHLLEVEQRQWLRTARDSCADAACLTKTYTRRLNQLDPFADHLLTCAEMRQFPKRAFPDRVDLGGGSSSPNEVDYKCPESLSQQKFMQPLLAITETILDGETNMCSGTKMHTLARLYEFGLTAAGFSRIYPNRSEKPVRAKGLNWAAFARANESRKDETAVRYFRQWSERSLRNRSLYANFTAEVDRTLPVLAQYFEVKLGMAKLKAQFAAQDIMTDILDRAIISDSFDEFEPDSRLVLLVRKSGSTAQQTRHALGTSKGKPTSYSQEEIGKALRVALINNRPLPIVSALADMLDTKALGRKKAGEEPLLSFAIGSQQNLEYLLRKKAQVDAANDFGKTTLFYAIGSGNHQAVAALLRAGANVNHAYKSAEELTPEPGACVSYDLKHTKRTPLMHAAQNSDVPMLRALVRAHAQLNVTDEVGYNAFDYAVLGKLKDNQRYLKSLGLKSSPTKEILY